jgi:two-component system sensor histidine kinase AlgZ
LKRALGHSSFAPDAPDDFFLPDFCGARMVFGIVLFGELVALCLALARAGTAPFLTELARVSFFVQWLGLSASALLCLARKPLSRLPVAVATLAVFAILILDTALLSGIAVWIGGHLRPDGYGILFARDFGPFALRNSLICVIVAAMLLRYFFVSHQWRHHVRAEARSRIHALQARIRPHFLFNSMNTIASLTRSDPVRAEEAVEDLADLFRATLRDSESLLSLKEELELTRIYQRIEMLRLGERLQVTWDVAELPMRALIPGLTIQPLLENAIYHGIESIDTGGRVRIEGRCDGDTIEIRITNPVPADRAATERSGNRLALENIRERLHLAYGARGRLDVEPLEDEYRVTMRFPLHV